MSNPQVRPLAAVLGYLFVAAICAAIGVWIHQQADIPVSRFIDSLLL